MPWVKCWLSSSPINIDPKGIVKKSDDTNNENAELGIKLISPNPN
jgi:hypothetical protein